MSSSSGQSFLGFSRSQSTGPVQRCVNPATSVELAGDFFQATEADVLKAATLAAAAAPSLSALSGKFKAQFLRDIATRIEAATPKLVARATQETGLPEARCQGEIGRTIGQLRLFADLVDKGDWIDARIETANPERKPLPKPDHRSMLRPLGPVAVFCASNFPFAYSVAGGDTASAFAAGCPVIVMAHHAHCGTAEIMGGLIVDAVRACNLPEGTFSLLIGQGRVVGQQLAKHPALRAIGFTGSRLGGRALMDTAAARPSPIPVYAEMSSVNPVVLLQGALAARGEGLATGMLGSCTLGVGQFCTQPGLLILERSAEAETFIARLATLFAEAAEGVMLTSGIHHAYVNGLVARAAQKNVRVLAQAKSSGDANRATPTLFATEAAVFLNNDSLQEEIFGPSSLVVWCANREERDRVVTALHGSLTATIHGTDDDLNKNKELVAQLEAIAGRLVINGFPTGVEVSHAIVHGGPYPSLSDGRSTSVGSNAIYRFTRLVCYQNFPDAQLPTELQNANPLGLSRLVNGTRSNSAI